MNIRFRFFFGVRFRFFGRTARLLVLVLLFLLLLRRRFLSWRLDRRRWCYATTTITYDRKVQIDSFVPVHHFLTLSILKYIIYVIHITRSYITNDGARIQRSRSNDHSFDHDYTFHGRSTFSSGTQGNTITKERSHEQRKQQETETDLSPCMKMRGLSCRSEMPFSPELSARVRG